MAALTNHPLRSRYKDPDEPDLLPPADAFVVAPTTFNTINKWAAGISDTLALGGQSWPSALDALIPWPNSALARHPAFLYNIARLREYGIKVNIRPGQSAEF